MNKKYVWIDETGGSNLYTDSLRITITHHIDYPPNVWLLRTSPAVVDLVPLKDTTYDGAKREALEYLEHFFSRLLAEVAEAKRKKTKKR